ncbi:MAG: OadG family protein [Clostridia bacterium]|nr:OadG family protein [Clostridia bacterium]MBR5423226.1 OadG family protein [Clostridia bacterium]
MNALGIYYSLYGDTPITLGRALLIAAVGFLIVFAVLGLIALFVKAMGKAFDAAEKKKQSEPASVPAAAQTRTSPPAEPALPENESAGQLVLTDVTEEEAALIMAIVSHKSGVPLNRLQFNSIRLVEDKS